MSASTGPSRVTAFAAIAVFASLLVALVSIAAPATAKKQKGKGLAKQVAALQARVAALEGKPAVNVPTSLPLQSVTYARNTAGCNIAEGTQGSCQASCPPGLFALGGGGEAIGGHDEQIELNGSGPAPSPIAGGPETAWAAFFDNNADLAPSTVDKVVVEVVCGPVANPTFVDVPG